MKERLAVTVIAALLLASPAPAAESASPAPDPAHTWFFSDPSSRRDWMHLTPGPGNDFSNGNARLSAQSGRAFLLNFTPQDADLAVEVKSTRDSGPSYAWLCLRWLDANNFYEVALKSTRLEIWRKHEGRYVPLLRSLAVNADDPLPHVLKAQIVGTPPSVAVWLDGRLLWQGADATGLPPLEGRHVALETEFSTVAIESVTISRPVAVDGALAALQAASTAPSLDSTAPAYGIQRQPTGPVAGYEETFKDLYDALGRQYPCFDLKGIDWKAVGDELLPRVRDVKTDEEFGRLCLELVARIEDSHAALLEGTAKVPSIPFPRWDPGLSCLIDDRGRPAIYHVDANGPAASAGVRPGMTVVSVNGRDALEVHAGIMKEAKRWSGYSSDRYLAYHAAQWLFRQMEQGAQVRFIVEDTGGKRYEHDLPATLAVRYLPRLPVPIPGINDAGEVSATMLAGGIGYIYVRRINANLAPSLDAAVKSLLNARGIIIDVRGNSGGGFDNRSPYRVFLPDDPAEPERPRYAGPIALLIDSRCISAGESFTSWFAANKRARIFGETTAGASSAKVTYTLKNGLYKVVIPVRARRGSLDHAIEYVGVAPDVPVRQNALDLANGRDTVLESAKSWLLTLPM